MWLDTYTIILNGVCQIDYVNQMKKLSVIKLTALIVFNFQLDKDICFQAKFYSILWSISFEQMCQININHAVTFKEMLNFIHIDNVSMF